MSSGALIAVFDVGKTNAKIALVDPALGQEIWSARRPNAVIRGALCRELDVAGIEAWLFETLRGAPELARVRAFVPIAHGAAAVLVDAEGAVLIAPDYEDPCFDEVAAAYLACRDPYVSTFSPRLPHGLNLGRQLFWLEQQHPDLFQRVAHVLLYPQYWAWRLSGVMAAEVTSLGTHTDLWRPRERSWSALAQSRGWVSRMPPLRSAAERLGRVSPAAAAATGLPAECEVACGIHDSNASYLRFLMDREREAFTVVSSGTWTIVMANRGELSRLAEERDMLANVNAFWSPVPTARYMGGREYEAIAQGTATPTLEALNAAISAGALALPAFASGGPFAGRLGTLENVAQLDAPARAALATLYSALMTALLIESLGSAGEIFVDGPLARNPLFSGLLAACVPAGSVRTYPEGGGTRVAAFLAGMPATAPEALQPVAPLRVAGLADYQRGWRERLAKASR